MGVIEMGKGKGFGRLGEMVLPKRKAGSLDEVAMCFQAQTSFDMVCLAAKVSNPWSAGHMQPRKALNTAQHEFLNFPFLKHYEIFFFLQFFFSSSAFVSVHVFYVQPKTVLFLTV